MFSEHIINLNNTFNIFFLLNQFLNKFPILNHLTYLTPLRFMGNPLDENGGTFSK